MTFGTTPRRQCAMTIRDVTLRKGPLVDTGVKLIEAELDAIARGFLGSQYAGRRFAAWPIDRRLHAYLLHRGLASIADEGDLFAASLDRVMDNIALARDAGALPKPA